MKRINIPVNKIAKSIGVSAATISRVIHHPELVSPDKKNQIESMLLEQGYNLKEMMRRETELSKRIIIVVVPSIINPFYYKILKGIESSAASHNFEVLIYQNTITKSNVENFLNVVEMTNARGVICLSRRLDCIVADRIFDAIPMVQCGEYNTESKSPYVSINDYGAAKGAVEYILNMGYKNVAIINGPLSYNYAKERLRGFDAAVEENQLNIPRSWRISLPDVAFDLGHSAACQLLSSNDRPDAIFCTADVFAAAVIRAANKFQIKIPQELGVVGFDNIDLASVTIPALTTINQPSFQTGFTAAESLFEIIHSQTIPRSILLDTELISRESIKNR